MVNLNLTLLLNVIFCLIVHSIKYKISLILSKIIGFKQIKFSFNSKLKVVVDFSTMLIQIYHNFEQI